jgi:hypothetical protein
MGITCDTPGTASSRGRMAKSAVSRNSIGSAPSPASATSMISPMIEEMGPMLGRMSSGKAACAVASRSATSCRARWMSASHSNST